MEIDAALESMTRQISRIVQQAIAV